MSEGWRSDTGCANEYHIPAFSPMGTAKKKKRERKKVTAYQEQASLDSLWHYIIASVRISLSSCRSHHSNSCQESATDRVGVVVRRASSLQMIMSRSAAETANETPRNQMRAGAAESSDLLQSLAVLFSWKSCTHLHTHAELQEVCGVVGGGVRVCA